MHIYIYTCSHKNNGFGVEMLHPTVSAVPARPSVTAARVKLPEGCPQPLVQGLVVICRCVLFFSALFCVCTAQHTPTQRGGALAALCPCGPELHPPPAAAPGMEGWVPLLALRGMQGSALAPHPIPVSLGPSVLAQPHPDELKSPAK